MNKLFIRQIIAVKKFICKRLNKTYTIQDYRVELGINCNFFNTKWLGEHLLVIETCGLKFLEVSQIQSTYELKSFFCFIAFI